MREISYLNVGIYPIAMAERITGVPARIIRSWFAKKDGETNLWTPQLPEENGKLVLGFYNLIEIIIVKHMRSHNISFGAIAESIKEAKRIYGNTHPFITRNFFIEAAKFLENKPQSQKKKKSKKKKVHLVMPNEDVDVVIDVKSKQCVLFELIKGPSLKELIAEERKLIFDTDDMPYCWYPLGRDKAVII